MLLTTTEFNNIVKPMGWEIIMMAQYGSGEIRASLWRPNANFPLVDEIHYSPKTPTVISLYRKKELVDTVAITR